MQRKIVDFTFEGINEEMLLVESLLHHPYMFDQGLIKVLRDNGTYTANGVMDIVSHSDKPIKIEGYERLNLTFFKECQRLATHFNHIGPVSCHLFSSPINSLSFEAHVDLEDVIVFMVKGQKTFEFVNGDMTLNEGESIYIPAGIQHRAVNTHESIMLSFGLERFHVEKI